MNAQTSIVRRLLPLALTCGLLVVLAPAVQAQVEEKAEENAQERAESKAALVETLGVNLSCETLVIAISGTSAAATSVSCNHGYSRVALPPSGAISTGKPLIFVLEQSAAYGPDCTITVRSGSNTAVLKAQQNYCGFAAGDITASVASGNATFNGSVRGSFPTIPGLVWFSLGF